MTRLFCLSLIVAGAEMGETYYDFRGGPIAPELTFGDREGRFIRPEPTGLRITLPKEQAKYLRVGLDVPAPLSGDFEITIAFDILRAEEPPSGSRNWGVGILLAVNNGRIGRYAQPGGRQVVVWDNHRLVDGNLRSEGNAVPCLAKTGRLRLKRTDGTLHYLWSPETMGDTFEEIHQCAHGDEVKSVRLVAETNKQECNLDVRLLDLRIRTQLSDKNVMSEAMGRQSHAWLLRLGTTIALVLLIGGGVWGFLRQRRRSEEAPAPAADVRQDVEPETAPGSISFLCSGCAKKLKAKAELAGKKIKCPECGQAVLVPGGGTVS